MKNIKLISIIIMTFVLVYISNKEKIYATTKEDAQIYADAVVYMLDLNLDVNDNGEFLFDIDILNKDYVDCFDTDYLNYFLANQLKQNLFIDNYKSDYEVEHYIYIQNKIAHENLTKKEIELLEQYNNHCDELHLILEYNDDIFKKIAEKNGATIEGIKEMRLYTPSSYDRTILGDEDYGHMFKSTYIELSQELQEFKKIYTGMYPFNYKVDVPWDYEFYTTQYDASLYGFYYPKVTQEFYSSFSNYDTIDGLGVKLKNDNKLISYTVYNDCIEVEISNSNLGNTIYAIVDIENGKIINTSFYIQMS